MKSRRDKAVNQDVGAEMSVLVPIDMRRRCAVETNKFVPLGAKRSGKAITQPWIVHKDREATAKHESGNAALVMMHICGDARAIKLLAEVNMQADIDSVN